MNTNLDDPRLTAYALGELTGDDLAAVEKILAADPAARQLVAEVRQTALRLEAELAGEELPSLTPQQTRAIEQKIGTRKPAAEEPSWWARQWIISPQFVGLMAAVVLIAVLAAMLLPALSKSKNKAKHFAMLNAQKQQALALQMDANSPVNTPVPVTPTADSVAINQSSSIYVAPLLDSRVSLKQTEKKWANPVPPTLPPLINGPATMPESTLTLPKSATPGLNGQLQMNVDQKAVAVKGNNPLQAGVSSIAPGDNFAFATGNGQVQLRASQIVTATFQPDPAAVAPANGQNPMGAFPGGNGLHDNIYGTQHYYRHVLPAQSSGQANTEAYANVRDNPFLAATENPLSTFSIDVDTASYANVRRFLTDNQLPPPDAVRIEELINYFSYNYPQPKGNVPFSVNAEVAGCPWNAAHRLVRIGLKGREIARDQRPASNLVFLIDVSGSMGEENKLPLLKESLKLLTRQLTEDDHVSIVTYAGAAGLALPPTSGEDKVTILNALDRLEAGGSTYGSAGIQMAYETAKQNFIQGGVNRVILCTDGDFNVGITSQGDLTRLIQDEAKSGVVLSVLGFGMGNLKDSTMEMLADKGHGNYAYIDSLNEGRRVLVEQMSATLVTIAKDVKLQIEFNPAQVNSYRLIGYENRLLAKEDFNNDKKDAGDIGAGHTVTALYEIVPAGQEADETPGVDPLKYQKPVKPSRAANSDELLTLKLRYKQPDGDTSRLLTTVVKDTDKSYNRASTDFKFAAAVAEFGMILRGSPYKGDADLNSAWEHAKASVGKDREGYRAEFLTMIEEAQRLTGK